MSANSRDFLTPLSRQDFLPAPSKRAAERLVGRTALNGSSFTESPSSTTVTLKGVEQDGHIKLARFLARVAPASGESITIDIQKNGVTILTGLVTIDDATYTVDRQWQCFTVLDPDQTRVQAGDVLTADYVYTAGGGPAMLGLLLVVDIV